MDHSGSDERHRYRMLTFSATRAARVGAFGLPLSAITRRTSAATVSVFGDRENLSVKATGRRWRSWRQPP